MREGKKKAEQKSQFSFTLQELSPFPHLVRENLASSGIVASFVLTGRRVMGPLPIKSPQFHAIVAGSRVITSRGNPRL
jgi:hypothetical protein